MKSFSILIIIEVELRLVRRRLFILPLNCNTSQFASCILDRHFCAAIMTPCQFDCESILN